MLGGFALISLNMALIILAMSGFVYTIGISCRVKIFNDFTEWWWNTFPNTTHFSIISLFIAAIIGFLIFLFLGYRLDIRLIKKQNG